MLGIFSNKSDHPLANLKAAQKLLDDLPKVDSVAVLHEIGQWIEALFDPVNEFRLDHQFAVLRILDEAAHPHLRKVIQGYFAAVPPSAFQENRLWSAMNEFLTFRELGYLDLIIGLKNGEKGGSGIKASIPLIIARGINAVCGRMECAAVKYHPLDSQLWARLAVFYSFAESENCLEEQLSLYAGPGASTTITSLFASSLVWYAASTGTFKPLEFHIAKRLIAYLNKSFTVSKQYQSGSLLAFDITKPAAPARIKEAGAMYPPGVRLIGVGASLGQLEGLNKTLEKNMVPEELNMGVAYSPDQVGEVVRRMAAYFMVTFPVRRPARRKIKMNISVLSGFFNMVEQTNVDLNLNDPVSESLEVGDVSANGLSYVLPPGKTGSVQIGTLVGIQADKSLHWGVGIVRRLQRDGENNLHVGVKVLSNKVTSVMLQADKGAAKYPALFLERPEDQAGESWILMKPDTFNINQSPSMLLGEQSYLMMPLGLEEKGDDFDVVRYRKMEHDNSVEETY